MSLGLQKMLKDFGLEEKEVCVYLALLELGTSHASHIAKKAKVNRSNCYAVLESLINQGLVNKSGKEKKFKFTATPPERLHLLIKEEQEKIENLEEKLKMLLPELKSIHDTTENLPKVRFIEGIKGIKSVYEDTLSSLPRGGEYWHLNPDIGSFMNLFGQDWLVETIKERVQKGIKSKAIIERTPWVEKQKKRDKKDNRQTVLLPPNIKMPSRLHIYNNKVAIFSLEKEPTGVIIEDKNIADLMRVLYQALWEKYHS